MPLTAEQKNKLIDNCQKAIANYGGENNIPKDSPYWKDKQILVSESNKKT